MAEINEALNNLEKHDFAVDVVLTHTAPSRISEQLAHFQMDDPTCKMLDQFERILTFKKWCFGHYHQDTEINDKFVALYNRVRALQQL